ncbi:discoidin domain-containing protein [Pectobacterium versatile]|uniref:discoidin domain-containing protein n=1 Tax=Pectobacterium versatile TaxID=2488639 RepID=UPI000D6142AF|nr:discoidin domain-containing protein [Pectobacterium versatile]PWD68402.1 carbohydrate-binding protein [Pectobacterium versatile]
MSDQVEIPDISDLPDMQEAAEFTPVVKLLTTETPVLGYDGDNINPANWQAKALADRTQWLRDRLLNLSTRLVMSVNGKTGNVVVTYNDVGADAAGTADALMTAHVTALDPHTQYFDETRGDARYVQRSLANQSNGWLQLDASGKIPASMLTVLASRYVVVANQAARLALASSANLTICAQADIDQLFYLNGGSNPAVAANWVAGQSATVSGVSSVYGRTGAVAAQNGDYDADKITETATRKFATTAEKTAWNAKQPALVSGTNIRSLFGQSLLGSGNLAPTPAQMGAAAAVHTHTTADITDYTQKTQQLITASLEAGTGVTLGYNPINGKTIISAAGGSGGAAGYIVVDRQGASAGQLHTFNISTQSAFNLAAFALKEEAGTTNVTFLVDDFNASSSAAYNVTDAVVFDGTMHGYSGGVIGLSPDGSYYSANIRSGAKSLEIHDASTASIIPDMTSNTSPVGYVVSASSTYSAANADWMAFSGVNSGFWNSAVGPSVSPQWLRIDLPSAKTIGGYSIQNRLSSVISSPKTWRFEGSNDGTIWETLHSVNNDTNNNAGAVREYRLSISVAYSSYRILITASNANESYAVVQNIKIFPGANMLIRGGDNNWYTANNGELNELSGADFSQGFSSSGVISDSSISPISPISVYAQNRLDIRVAYLPHSQIAIQKTLSSASSWSQINSATLMSTQNGNGKVRVAVTRDLVNWHVWRNGAWIDAGALSADTAGATKLIADGMTPTELGAITATQWTQLFSANNGVPDSLAFAFALDITDPAADVATIDRLLLNVNNTSSWRLQSPAEVEIRWRNDNVTFRNIASGNYKLAYQIP